MFTKTTKNIETENLIFYVFFVAFYVFEHPRFGEHFLTQYFCLGNGQALFATLTSSLTDGLPPKSLYVLRTKL